MLEERRRKILGEGFVYKFDYSMWSVRVNTLKISVDDMRKRFQDKGYTTEQTPWCDEGLWVKTKDNLSKIMEHVLGYFFIQNASSMIPPMVLNPSEINKILDLCASPGAKTTQIAGMMKNRGSVVANDINETRLKALRGNLQRCGVVNTVVTSYLGELFWKTNMKFDKILVDAPCTGTGTMNPRILAETSIGSIKKLSSLQKSILESASKCLEDGGTIVYSTCSLEPEENEEVIDFALDNLGLKAEKIDLDSPHENAFLEWEGRRFGSGVENAIRIMPSEKTEGFFVCKLKK